MDAWAKEWSRLPYDEQGEITFAITARLRSPSEPEG
jgi:hypothetical protein